MKFPHAHAYVVPIKSPIVKIKTKKINYIVLIGFCKEF
jgi:hypothetical protein